MVKTQGINHCFCLALAMGQHEGHKLSKQHPHNDTHLKGLSHLIAGIPPGGKTWSVLQMSNAGQSSEMLAIKKKLSLLPNDSHNL